VLGAYGRVITSQRIRRLATIQNATTIAVVDGGVVAEKGNHHALMNKNGLYAGMVHTQMRSVN
jgi:ABC-type multidrug transport system fused ATPase/permease subunit